jgi:FixJ family two-component response regulator
MRFNIKILFNEYFGSPKNIAKRLQKSENYHDDNDDLENEFVSDSNMKEKNILKGSLKEKLKQLENREKELLLEVNRLNNIIQNLNVNHSARKSHRSQSDDHRSSSSQTSEKSQLNVGNLA